MNTSTSTFVALVTALVGGIDQDDDKKKKASAPQITLAIREDSPVRGTRVLILDVATIQSAVPELTARVGNLDLGTTPQSGSTRRITRNDILVRLMRAGFPASRVKFSGPEKTYLHAVTHSLTPVELTRSATDILDRAIVEEANPDITYRLRSRLSIRRIPAGRESRVLEARLHTGGLGVNHAQVDVKVIVDGEVFKIIPIYFGLTRYYEVLAASYTLHPGDTLNESNVEWKRVEAQFGVSQYLTDLAQIRGLVAKRNIQRGVTLTHSHLTVRAIVHSGDIVQLVVGGGLITVKTRVRALDSGHLGKFIRVSRLGATSGRRRAAANPVLVAKIVSPNTVVINTSFDNR